MHRKKFSIVWILAIPLLILTALLISQHYYAVLVEKKNVLDNPIEYLQNNRVEFAVNISGSTRDRIQLSDSDSNLPLDYNGLAVRENLLAQEDQTANTLDLYVSKELKRITLGITMIKFEYDLWDGNDRFDYYENSDDIFEFIILKSFNNQIEEFIIKNTEHIDIKPSDNADWYKFQILVLDKVIFGKEIRVHWLETEEFNELKAKYEN